MKNPEKHICCRICSKELGYKKDGLFVFLNPADISKVGHVCIPCGQLLDAVRIIEDSGYEIIPDEGDGAGLYSTKKDGNEEYPLDPEELIAMARKVKHG
jgi:hypothetical protein